jgi:hypothetical protein
MDLQEHQARITIAQMPVADAFEAMAAEGTRERMQVAVRELNAAWRDLLRQYAADAERLLDRVT